ncbi:MAG: nickel-dependent lactate racemase [Chloroflexi bacterium]|nr:nickel-dependent lactate racemase [Chloroflexota bacterium]
MMTQNYSIPYGKTRLAFTLPDTLDVQVIAPADVPAASDPTGVVRATLDELLGGIRWGDFAGARSAAVAVNDKTRPVPHDHLLPPLLERLESLGLAPGQITLIVATGTHPPMPPGEFPHILPAGVLARYPVICHNCDDAANLVYRGQTSRGTPVWINRQYAEADLRLVVGNIEPHQFMGFSGGVKSAAIGLAGRETINRNHALMMDEHAQLGCYDGNPAREDVEDIGRLIDVHMALNAVLNGHKQIVRALAGSPPAVMRAGIPVVNQLATVPVDTPFDLIIAAPGGHPKDINLYQSQKALAHAALITRPGGTIILAAACPEGTGSQKYEGWMLEGMGSFEAVFERFAREGFQIGPHKAYQIARDAASRRVLLVSDMPPDFVRRLLLTPAALDEAIQIALADLPPGGRIGILPAANATVPLLAAHPS